MIRVRNSGPKKRRLSRRFFASLLIRNHLKKKFFFINRIISKNEKKILRFQISILYTCIFIKLYINKILI